MRHVGRRKPRTRPGGQVWCRDRESSTRRSRRLFRNGRGEEHSRGSLPPCIACSSSVTAPPPGTPRPLAGLVGRAAHRGRRGAGGRPGARARTQRREPPGDLHVRPRTGPANRRDHRRHLERPILPDEGFRERNGGEWQGRTGAEIEAGWPGMRAAWRRGELTAPPGGESDVTVLTRVDAALARALDHVGAGGSWS